MMYLEKLLPIRSGYIYIIYGSVDNVLLVKWNDRKMIRTRRRRR